VLESLRLLLWPKLRSVPLVLVERKSAVQKLVVNVSVKRKSEGPRNAVPEPKEKRKSVVLVKEQRKSLVKALTPATQALALMILVPVTILVHLPAMTLVHPTPVADSVVETQVVVGHLLTGNR
jgi:hypothetical protein